MHAIITFITVALSGFAAASPQGVPDKPIEFYGRIYADSANCSGTGTRHAYLGSMGNCINRSVPGTGSATMVVGEVSKYFFAGWTGPDCTGKVVLVVSNVGECVDLGGIDVQSWSNDMKPFGK